LENLDKKNKFKILLVDDDADFREMLSEILIRAGYKVTTSVDGVDGSFKYSNETFDLVITDIKMPKKDGIKFVQYIQADEANKKMKLGSTFKPIPIIFISASLQDFQIEIELLGNIDVFAKPFKTDEVLDKVHRILHKAPATHASGVLNFKQGSAIFKEGDQSSDLFFVKEGTLNIFKKAHNGLVVKVTSVGPGEMVGEMGVLLGKIRTATVIAATDCVLINVQKDKVADIFASQPKWFKVLVDTVTGRLEDTTQALVEERAKKS
jgi:CheY-like chemotaxis protein